MTISVLVRPTGVGKAQVAGARAAAKPVATNRSVLYQRAARLFEDLPSRGGASSPH